MTIKIIFSLLISLMSLAACSPDKVSRQETHKICSPAANLHDPETEVAQEAARLPKSPPDLDIDKDDPFHPADDYKPPPLPPAAYVPPLPPADDVPPLPLGHDYGVLPPGHDYGIPADYYPPLPPAEPPADDVPPLWSVVYLDEEQDEPMLHYEDDPLQPSFDYPPLWYADGYAAFRESDCPPFSPEPEPEPEPESEPEPEPEPEQYDMMPYALSIPENRRTANHIIQMYGHRFSGFTEDEIREDLATYGYTSHWLRVIMGNMIINNLWYPPMSDFVMELINFLEQP
jgi:hypothetical protein